MTREEIIEERRLLRAEYRELFDEVSALLFRHDPVGINFETNGDEYEPEVGTILPRLQSCGSVDDVGRVVHEEFVRWFGADTAGSHERYAKIASEILEHWQRFSAAYKTIRPTADSVIFLSRRSRVCWAAVWW